MIYNRSIGFETRKRNSRMLNLVPDGHAYLGINGRWLELIGGL